MGCSENSIETSLLLRVKQITSPGWMHETSARAWCTGMTQRNLVEREMGRGIGMGNICKSMADSCQCMTKPLQYCKVISLQLIKINGKKKSIIFRHKITKKLQNFKKGDCSMEKCCRLVAVFCNNTMQSRAAGY